MADNTTLNIGVGGDQVRDIDRSLNPVPVAAKTPVMQLDAGGQNAESLVSAANGLPTIIQSFGPDPALALALIYAELRLMTAVIAQGFNITESLDAMRADPAYLAL